MFLLFLISLFFIQIHGAAPKTHFEKIAQCLPSMRVAIPKKPQLPDLHDLVEARVERAVKLTQLDVDNLIEVLNLAEKFAAAHNTFFYALEDKKIDKDVSAEYLALIHIKPLLQAQASSSPHGKRYFTLKKQYPKELEKLKALRDQYKLGEAQTELAQKIDDIKENTPGAARVLFSVLSKNNIRTLGDLLDRVELTAN